jgi:hypothetical protein
MANTPMELYHEMFLAYWNTTLFQRKLDTLYKSYATAMLVKRNLMENAQIQLWYIQAQAHFETNGVQFHTCDVNNTMWKHDIEYRDALVIDQCPKCSNMTSIHEYQYVMHPTYKIIHSLYKRLNSAEMRLGTWDRVRTNYLNFAHSMMIAYIDRSSNVVEFLHAHFEQLYHEQSFPVESPENIYNKLVPLFHNIKP